MSALARQLSTKEIANRVFSERQLAELLGGSAARRYGMVNRALRPGRLTRVEGNRDGRWRRRNALQLFHRLAG